MASASRNTSFAGKRSSHPVGQPRDRSKYNNHREQGNDSREEKKLYPSQEELCEYLTADLRENKFVEVRTNKITNKFGNLYEIDVVNRGLYKIGNGTFYSLKLHTVSHQSRIIYIRLVFNDDDNRNADIKINADAIIQILRDTAPSTFNDETISIKDIEDSKGAKHLVLLAESAKKASLNFTYKMLIKFIHTIDEKYNGECEDTKVIKASRTGGAAEPISSHASTGEDSSSMQNLSLDEIQKKQALLEKQMKALEELRLAQQSSTDESSTNEPAVKPRAKIPSAFNITVGNRNIKVSPKRSTTSPEPQQPQQPQQPLQPPPTTSDSSSS